MHNNTHWVLCVTAGVLLCGLLWSTPAVHAADNANTATIFLLSDKVSGKAHDVTLESNGLYQYKNVDITLLKCVHIENDSNAKSHDTNEPTPGDLVAKALSNTEAHPDEPTFLREADIEKMAHTTRFVTGDAALVEVLMREENGSGSQVFLGWLYAEHPSLTALGSPLIDLRLKHCANTPKEDKNV